MWFQFYNKNKIDNCDEYCNSLSSTAVRIDNGSDEYTSIPFVNSAVVGLAFAFDFLFDILDVTWNCMDDQDMYHVYPSFKKPA